MSKKNIHKIIALIVLCFSIQACQQTERQQTEDINDVGIKQEQEKIEKQNNQEEISKDMNWDIDGTWYCEKNDLWVDVSDSRLGRDDSRVISAYYLSAYDVYNLYESECILPDNTTFKIDVVERTDNYSIIFDESTVTLFTKSGDSYELSRYTDEEIEEYLDSIREDDYSDVEEDINDDTSIEGTWKFTQCRYTYVPDPEGNHFLSDGESYAINPDATIIYIMLNTDGSAVLNINGLVVNGTWSDEQITFDWVIDSVHYRHLHMLDPYVENGELNCRLEDKTMEDYIFYYTFNRSSWPE